MGRRTLGVGAVLSATLAVVASCSGQVASTSTDAKDASTDAIAIEPTDAGASLYDGPCDPDKPFDKPVEAPFKALNANPILVEAYLTSDELGVFFTSDLRFTQARHEFISHASRPTVAAAFGDAQALPSPPSDAGYTGYDATYAPVVTPDGLTLYFRSTTNVVTDPGVVMKSVRTDRTSAWQMPIATSISMTPQDWFEGELWLVDVRGNVGSVHRAAEVDGGLRDPQPVPELGTVGTVKLAQGGKRAFVAKEGGIFTATRADSRAAFGPLVEEPSLEAPVSAGGTTVAWVSSDGCRVVLAGERTDVNDPNAPYGWYDGHSSRLYLAVRPR